jgi:hypothetical protein
MSCGTSRVPSGLIRQLSLAELDIAMLGKTNVLAGLDLPQVP